jgi:hypothetical protein
VPSAIPAGAYITIGGANSETVQTQSAVAASATTTTIAVTSALLAHASGSAVTWQTTDCSDAATPSTGANSYPTHGGDLNFAPTGGDPLCHSAILAVQEITGTSAYCWTGNGSAPENYQGLCTMPVSTTVNGSLGTGSKSSIPVSSLNGIVQANDTISVTDGTNTQTFQASGNVLPSLTATSIPITTATSNFAFASATVTDTTSIGTLASDTTDTIANFDTAHPSSTGKLFLYRLSGAGTDTLSGAYAANVTALTLGAALTMTIPAGSQIHIGGTNPETVTTTAQAAVGATTVSVSATTKTHSSGDAVSFVGLNTNALNAQLPKYSSNVPRTFWISVFLPAPAGATQNSLQGIQSTFGLLWHVDQ